MAVAPSLAALTDATTTTIAIFVIAHPDDEAMFFLPTICGLKHHKQQNPDCQLWLVCLSNGNYNGLGKQREQELYQSCNYPNCFDQIHIIHHSQLQDSPITRWPLGVIAHVLNQLVLGYPVPNKDSSNNNNNIDNHDNNHQPTEEDSWTSTTTTFPHRHYILYTFDSGGVSGHVNHIDTHAGVLHWWYQQQNSCLNNHISITVNQLKTTTNPFHKYVPIQHWILLLTHGLFSWVLWICGFASSSGTTSYNSKITHNNSQSRTTTKTYFTLYQPWINWKCMALHASQFVWYRRLFVIFSCYTYENYWEPLEAGDGTSSSNGTTITTTTTPLSTQQQS